MLNEVNIGKGASLLLESVQDCKQIRLVHNGILWVSKLGDKFILYILDNFGEISSFLCYAIF